MGSVSNIKTCVTQLGTVGSDLNFFIFEAPEQCHIESIYIVTGTTKAADNSNYATVTIKNLGVGGAGTITVATSSNNAAGLILTADVPKAFVMSTTAAYHEVAVGEVLQAQVDVSVAGTCTFGAETAIIVNWVPGTGSGQ